MTHYLSKRSIKNLETCDPELIDLVEEAITNCPIDFGISYGHRTQEEQFELYKKGREERGHKWVLTDPSKKVTNIDGYEVMSKHNHSPSLAFDFICYVNGKVTWKEKYYVFVAGYIMGKAQELGINVTWGGNFDRDNDIMEKGTFNDLGHFEIA